MFCQFGQQKDFFLIITSFLDSAHLKTICFYIHMSMVFILMFLTSRCHSWRSVMEFKNIKDLLWSNAVFLAQINGLICVKLFPIKYNYSKFMYINKLLRPNLMFWSSKWKWKVFLLKITSSAHLKTILLIFIYLWFSFW